VIVGRIFRMPISSRMPPSQPRASARSRGRASDIAVVADRPPPGMILRRGFATRNLCGVCLDRQLTTGLGEFRGDRGWTALGAGRRTASERDRPVAWSPHPMCGHLWTKSNCYLSCILPRLATHSLK
jgi:hypothetical protein